MKPAYILPVVSSLASAYQYGTGAGPDDTYQSYNQNPNATGSVSLLGVDMTSNSSSTSPKDWTAAINVTEVPVSGGYLTNSVISFNANGAFVANSTSWATCAMIMYSVARNATEKGQDDSGDCRATLGDRCKADWIARINTAVANAGNAGDDPCLFTPPRIPDSCIGTLAADSIAGAITSNFTMGEAWFYATESQPPHQASNFTAYETAATRIWPVLLIQANNDTKTFSTQMGCLRAKNAAQGSHEIGDVPGAGSRVEGVWWGLAAVFAVMGFLI